MALTGTLTATTAAASASQVHVSHALFGMHDGSGGRSFAHIHEGSVRLWDVGVQWRDIELSPHHYTWTTLDQLVSQAQAAHAEVTMVVAMTPGVAESTIKEIFAQRPMTESRMEELTREIKDVARRQLGEHGSAGLSLRAVARELGMVSSAVYRYFPSRDELLTALIIDAYQAIADAAEHSESRVRRGDLAGRWLATARAMRRWAVEHPQEYALIFGSPVPGYQAPQDTIDPAARNAAT